MYKIKYDTNKYNFSERLKEVFSVFELENIVDESIPLVKRETDQNTIWHKKYYEWARSEDFKTIYNQFILEVVRPLYEETIVFQKIPTFRIAYPNNIAVGEWHKDKWYRDINWADKVKEDNFFLPFTDAYDTNTIWTETFEDSGDFYPMNCNYGEIIKWDGSNLTHGNKINKTKKTRISVDFRIIKFTNYTESDFGSINTKSKFKIGEYYDFI